MLHQGSKCRALCGTRWFMTVFTTARHLSLHSASSPTARDCGCQATVLCVEGVWLSSCVGGLEIVDVSTEQTAFTLGGSSSAVEDNGCTVLRNVGNEPLLHSLTIHKAESPKSCHLRLGLRNVFSAGSQPRSLPLISRACYMLDPLS